MIDVSPITGETAATLELDEDVPLESITAGDCLVLFAQEPRLRATLTNTGDVIVLTGTVEGVARLECSRCLEPFDLSMRGSLEGTFADAALGSELPDEEEWYPLAGGRADLLPAIESALCMEIPFAPLHDPACRGICPTCGCDLNRDQCTCEQSRDIESDGPFAALKGLLPPEDE